MTGIRMGMMTTMTTTDVVSVRRQTIQLQPDNAQASWRAGTRDPSVASATMSRLRVFLSFSVQVVLQSFAASNIHFNCL